MWGKCYVRLELPPAGDMKLAVAYNNRLMRLCQLTHAEIVKVATKKAETRKAKEDGPEDVRNPAQVGADEVGAAAVLPGEGPAPLASSSSDAQAGIASRFGV